LRPPPLQLEWECVFLCVLRSEESSTQANNDNLYVDFARRMIYGWLRAAKLLLLE
jgi:hypothetical protein